jgi:ATP-dependent Clp protease, protease subunit
MKNKSTPPPFGSKQTTSNWGTLLRVLGIVLLLSGTIGGGLYVVGNMAASLFSSPTTPFTQATPTTPTGQAVDFPDEEFPVPIDVAVNALKPKTLDLTKGDPIIILLYGPIMQNGNEIAAMIRSASMEGKPIYLLIDSPGGSVISGGAIVSAIEASEAPVYTVCLQVCASMAAMIHQYGTKRYMVDRSLLMFHNASGGFEGSLPQVASLFHTINRYVNKMFLNAARRSNRTLKEFLDEIQSDYWIDAEDSLAERYSDETVSVVYSEQDALNPPDFLIKQAREAFKQKMSLMDIK